MNIKEKLDSSLKYPCAISLFLEGTFWKAYEQSAFLFVNEKQVLIEMNENCTSAGFEEWKSRFAHFKLKQNRYHQP